MLGITAGVSLSCDSAAPKFSLTYASLLAPRITVLTFGFFRYHARAIRARGSCRLIAIGAPRTDRNRLGHPPW